MKRSLAFAALLSVAIVPGCGEEESAPEPALPRPVEPVTLSAEVFGVNGHVLRALSAGGETLALDGHLDSIAAGGLSFVRANVDWGQFEPEAPQDGEHSFDPSGTDAWVEALAEHGLRWHVIGVGASTPEWAVSPATASACGGRAPPKEPGYLAEMMQGIAARYGQGGTFWAEHPELPSLPIQNYEVWNEPNHGGFWCPTPNPTAFAEYFMQAAEAIRREDSRADVIVGGLAPFHETTASAPGIAAKTDVESFLAGMIEARPDLPGAATAIGVHAYGSPELIISDVQWYRAIVDSLGMRGTPLSLNEIGWPTDGDGIVPVAEAARTDYMAELTPVLVASNCGVDSYAPHTWVTEEADPADAEEWFGMADPETGRPYAIAKAYFELSEEILADRSLPQSQVAGTCER